MTDRNSHLVRDAFSYALMPRVFVRFRDLAPDFLFFAQLLVQVFLNVGLLPKGHPYALRPTGYGVRDVLAAAAANLKGGWRNSDQYIVYGAFVLGMVLLVIQFVALFVMMISQGAQAAGPFLSMFVTSDPTDDIAFMMLDKVFQIPGFFQSNFDPGTAANIEPLALGMQELFRFYSYGMLIVAFFIVLYYLFALAVETAQTGVPFGKRFPSVYGPIRLVLAILLLLPLSYGYNTGQYLTLLMARWGSSFGTNAWLVLNGQTLATAYKNPMGLGSNELIAKPKVQPIHSLVNFFYLVHTCKAAYKIAYGSKIADIQPYFVVPADAINTTSVSTLMTSGSSFVTTLNSFHQGDIIIVFGEKNAKHVKYPGNVKPYCGEVTIPVLSKNVPSVVNVYNVYFSYIMSLWANTDLARYGENMSYIVRFMDKLPGSYTFTGTSVPWDAPLSITNARPAGPQFYTDMRLNAQAVYNGAMDAAIVAIRSTSIPDMQMSSQVLDLGWAGAGVWYNKISEYNGALTDTIYMVPEPTKYPMVMEVVAGAKQTIEPGINPKLRFSLSTTTGSNISLEQYLSGHDLDTPAVDSEIAKLLAEVYQTVADDSKTARPTQAPVANNPIRNMFMFVYETTGLMDIRGNDDVYPLAKLSMLGKSIINKTIISLGAGTLMVGFGSMLSGAGSENLGAAFDQGGGVLLSFASTGLVIGFILYYLLPFFPFLYFFFAAGRWVKAIFEAMVAVPLWALAHLRLDGEGVGNAASKGYFLLLEIFLRPIFCIFGLLASISIFSALSVTLDTIFDLVVWNVAGYDMTTLSSSSPTPAGDFFASFRDGIDAFFFTIFYTILIYMIATSCFKLIDLIPNKLLRFIQPVPTFHEGAGDPAENLVRNTAFAGQSIVGQFTQGLGDVSRGVGTTVGRAYKESTKDKVQGPNG